MKIFISFLLLATLLTSCKKDTPIVKIEGEWQGEFIYNNGSSNELLSLLFNADKTCIWLNSPVIESGTWSYTNNQIIIELKYKQVYGGGTLTMTGTHDVNSGKLTGTWFNSDYTGTWYVAKK